MKLQQKNIIFDLDGTLINSMPIWDNIGRNFLLSKGVNPPDDLEEKFEKMSFEESAQYFIDEFNLKMTVKEIIGEIIKSVEEKYIKEIPLKNNVYEFLECMKKEGKKMCLLTASEEAYVYPALERLKIKDFFQNIFTCSSLGMSKSRSDIYDTAAEKCGFKKDETAVFEDALHAIENAKKAGFFVYAVYDAHEEKNSARIKEIADVYLKDFDEIMG